jgi:hypothetical protein
MPFPRLEPAPDPAFPPAGDGFRPSGDEARSELARELARPEYAQAVPNPLLQFLRDAWTALMDWLAGLDSLQPNLGSLVVLLFLAALAAAAVLLVRPRVRRRAAPAAADVGLVEGMTSDSYRRLAADAADAGDWSAGCVHRFRALVRQAEERTLLDAQPGRTAFEVAGRLEAAFPGEAGELRRAATLFNEVLYGHHSASADDCVRVGELDARLATATPGDGAASPARALAVPR